MNEFREVVNFINDWMYSKVLIVMLIGVGLYFTFRTGFIQFRMLGEALRTVREKPHEKGAVSSFHALMVSTASRVGTGNIVGVAGAITIGGYGTVFWMWVIALIGSASAFVESTLAQIYKKRNSAGGSYGGPSYYIEVVLKNRFLGIVFAVALIATYGFGFNMLAAFNLVDTLSVYDFYNTTVAGGLRIAPVIAGLLLALLFTICALGGAKRLVKVTTWIVPFMGILYILVSFVVIGMNIQLLPATLLRIFEDALNVKALFGGIAGSAIVQGVKRGLFSNEAGIGSAPNAAATAEVSHPVKQGLVQMLSVFIDTILICTATAMMCLCSGVAFENIETGGKYVQAALNASFGYIGPVFITVAMILFAFTTLLGNLFYCDACLNYIAGRTLDNRALNLFRLLVAVFIFLGTQLEAALVWDIADVLMGVMALINLPVIVILGNTVLKALNDYIRQKKEGKNPVFKAASIGLEGKTEFWG
ncbi:alanine/glycine:cation symporter family protein [Acetivibrio ethanolgignens]